MENISVSIRIRPLSKSESQDAWRVDGNTISQVGDRSDVKYPLDHVFGPDFTTEQIYELTAKMIIQKVVSGFNGTVFAYGQTSSGKTYTMRGGGTEAGLIPLAVRHVFHLIEASQDREYLIRVSYTELYNEEVNDLLAPENMKLPIHESKENGIYVCGLREDIVTSPEQVLALLEEGENNRHVGSTKMNEKSSRSHTLFRMVVESRARGAESDDAGAILVSTLTLVDLAGSERVAKTGAEGIRMKEGTAINKSLLTLGNVINKLAEGAQVTGGHIPYRDSKLTRILQPSLGGNAKTAVICAMTPALCHVEESHSTLRFASRAKRVVNNAVVNEVLSDAAVLKRQAKEIEDLKKRLGMSGSEELNKEVHGQIAQLRAQLLRSEQEMQLMRTKLEEEKTEREKAQKQAEMAKKIMLGGQQRGAVSGDGSGHSSVKRNSRRDTWCPGGKAGWHAPSLGGLGVIESSVVSEEKEDSGDMPGSTGGRKRSLSRGGESEDGADSRAGGRMLKTRGSGSLYMEQLAEEGEDAEEQEEEDVAEEEDGEGLIEGPTPQRPRRDRLLVDAGSSKMSEHGSALHGEVLISDIKRLAASLPPQGRASVSILLEKWQSAQLQSTVMQRELDDITAISQSREEELRNAGLQATKAEEELARMFPQMEQLKWQLRQQQKHAEDQSSAMKDVCKVRDNLVTQLSATETDLAASREVQANQTSLLSEERLANKEQTKKLTLELADLRGKLELQMSEKMSYEAKSAAHTTELSEMEMKLKERIQENEGHRKAAEANAQALREVEARARELYECNQRLEAHVHDLESRKRAPLYQKKQEEELRVANEKASEAEVRAQDAEMKMKELKELTEAAEKRSEELGVELEKSKKQSTEVLSDAIEQHSLELQRASHERSLLQAMHKDQLSSLTSELSELQSLSQSLKEQLAVKDSANVSLEETIIDLRNINTELQAVQVELQACVSAAAEKISSLEEAAESTQAAHGQELREKDELLIAAKAEFTAASASFEAKLVEASTAASAAADMFEEKLKKAAMDAASDASSASEELKAEKTRSQNLVLASMEECGRLTKSQEDLQHQVASLQAKVAEAAGALKAKEELREERLKFKQETAALKSDLQKLQLESKTGNKGVELATKEIDALKKRLTDTETKLKVAVSDKQAAVAEKATLEKQVKQQQGQKLLIEKNLEKSTQIESKKRESIMINLSKSKEQLNSTEERLKQAVVDVQKLQMDLMAKKGEAAGLEEQVTQLETEGQLMRAERNSLSIEVTTLTHNLECLQKEHSDIQSQLSGLQAQYESLQTLHETSTTALTNLEVQYQQTCCDRDTFEGKFQHLSEAHMQLTDQNTAVIKKLDMRNEELEVVSKEVDALKATISLDEQRIQAMQAALSASEDAKAAAESRVPEIEELQKLLSSTTEELTDLQFQATEAKRVADAQHELLSKQVHEVALQLQLSKTTETQLKGDLEASKLQVSTLQQQLDEAVELYNIQTDASKALEARVTASEAQIAFVEVELSDLRSLKEFRESELQCQLVTLQEHKAVTELELQIKIQALKDDKDAMQGKLLDMEKHVAEAQNASEERVGEYCGQLTAVQGEVATLNQNLCASHDKIRVLESAVTDLEGQVQAARQEFNTVVEQKLALTVCLEEAAQRLLGAERRLGELQALAADENDTILKLRSAEETIAQHMAEKESSKGEVESLTQQLSTMAQELNDLQFSWDQEKAVLVSEVKSVHDRLAEAVQNNNLRAVEEVSALREELSIEKQQQERCLHELEDSVQELQRQLEAERQVVNSLQVDLDNAQQALQQMTCQQVLVQLPSISSEEQLLHPSACVSEGTSDVQQRRLDDMSGHVAELEAEIGELQAMYNRGVAQWAESERSMSMRLLELEGLVMEHQDRNTVLESQCCELRQKADAADMFDNSCQPGLESAVDPNALADAAQHQGPEGSVKTSTVRSFDENESGGQDSAVEDIAQLKLGLANAMTAHDVLHAKLSAREETLQQSQEAVHVLADKNAALLSSMEDANVSIQELKLEIQNLRVALERETSKHKESGVLLDQFSTEAHDLSQKLQAAQSEASEASLQLLTAHAALAESQTVVRGLEEAKWKLEDQLVRSQRQAQEDSLQAAKWRAEAGASEEGSRELLELNMKLEIEVKQLKEDVVKISSCEAGGSAGTLKHTLTQLEEELTIISSRALAKANLATSLEEQVQQLTQALKEAEKALTDVEESLSVSLTAQRQALQDAAAAQVVQHEIALEELELTAKAKEAELNARMLSLESQIHWLTEQNTHLIKTVRELPELQTGQKDDHADKSRSAGAMMTPASSAAEQTAELEGLREKSASLEQELRKTKRAEQKLQALLYRLRKDVADSKGDLGALLDSLKDVRSLQYDVDMLSQKLKRYERNMQVGGSERKVLRNVVAFTSAPSDDLPEGGASGLAPNASLPLQESSLMLDSMAGQQARLVGTREGTEAVGKNYSQATGVDQMMKAASTEDKENAGYTAVSRRRMA
ncbi:hypothetical protein CEUSTIGMA_g4707.t1 [Chlamydomonas eustigma]|uniref:Kinesin motor domain-containing protein n=1 Tax=Chlamydomonas eustigma TaxID=1157962 RepID=A0A250X2G8_9CHLO|nr:hypothetical protein CEUSTIGMA_g4707.t1 [Chlamydomonas eustigma]|eukprot:GAX77261.1 hypothetical protein CEUSTIGMA_g4707.t1 [Chlamydomonas eustigma]